MIGIRAERFLSTDIGCSILYSKRSPISSPLAAVSMPERSLTMASLTLVPAKPLDIIKLLLAPSNIGLADVTSTVEPLPPPKPLPIPLPLPEPSPEPLPVSFSGS